MKGKKFYNVFVAIALVLALGCAPTGQINKSQLIHDLAFDTGYLGYVLSPNSQAYLVTGCTALAAIQDPASRAKALQDLLSKVWVEANTPTGYMVALLINNLVGSMGLNLSPIPMDSATVAEVKAAVAALCEGVKAA